MPSYKHRWTEPTDRTLRDEYRELRRELKLSRTSKARRTEIENRLDAIAEKEPSAQSILSKALPAQLERRAHYLRLRLSAADGPTPSRRSRMQNELVELTGGSVLGITPEKEEGISDRSPVSPQSKPAETVSVSDFEAGLARLAIEDRARAIRKAANATPQEKAIVILSELPEHPLNKLAAELATYIANEDRSNPRPSLDLLSKHRVQHWLSDAPYNRHDLRGSRSTVDAAVASALKLVADLDAADPDWFVRRTERLFDAPPSALTKPTAAHESLQTAERVRTNPVPSGAQPDEPTLNPIERASADLAARAALILRTDSWLSRLAEHSPEMRTRILAALGEELLRTGFVNGDFATRLYNDSRPKALSQFPPRQF